MLLDVISSAPQYRTLLGCYGKKGMACPNDGAGPYP